ncbi:MAG: folylpolyglutamate synthase/dihydrofolate synthase family protein [Terracidiphilus sp.]
MSYSAAIDQLSAMTPELYTQPSQIRRKFSLAEIGTLLDALGNPHRRFRSILIAGTNGKGSTASTLASILAASGLRTGLYTSPHLTRPNERIRINGVEISDDDFAALYFRVHDCGERLVAGSSSLQAAPSNWSSSVGRKELVSEPKLAQLPSFFETLTAMAFLHFAESTPGSTVDLAVLEVGMGGRLDATNIVDPLLSIVTDISLDHTEWLGPTIAAIAREKAGILHTNGTLITLPQHPEANQILGEVATELNVRAISAVPYMPATVPHAAPGRATSSREIATQDSYPVEVLGSTIEIASPLQGAHQHRNIALAIAAAAELATQHSVPITPDSIAAGIRQTRWPARLERVSTPIADYILDVAHNPAGAWALRAALRSLQHLGEPDAPPATLIFSCLRDKPVTEMAQILFPLFDQVIFAPIHSSRATPMSELLAAAASTGTPARAADSVAQALEWTEAAPIASNTLPSNPRAARIALRVVAGSVYLVGEIRPLLLNRASSNLCAGTRQ